jgi:hypothetical protein
MAGAVFASIMVVSDYVTYVVRRRRIVWWSFWWSRPQCWPSDMQRACLLDKSGINKLAKRATQARDTASSNCRTAKDKLMWNEKIAIAGESRCGDDLKVEMCGWCTAVYECAQALAVVVETGKQRYDIQSFHGSSRRPMHPQLFNSALFKSASFIFCISSLVQALCPCILVANSGLDVHTHLPLRCTALHVVTY